MNPMLQRHCAKYIYIVPDGLRELMSDISREVIRSQPEQIYTFIADYLDALMITRENARIAARMVENISEIAEVTVNLLVHAGMSRSDADSVVTVIQTYFRALLAKKRKSSAYEIPGEDVDMNEINIFTNKILSELNIEYKKLDEVTRIIQNAYRNFLERREREKQLLFGMVDWRIAARSAIRLYRKTGVTYYEANRAATLIKAAYKGYYTRRVMKRLVMKALEEEEITFVTESGEEIQEETVGTIPSYTSFTEEEEEEAEGTMAISEAHATLQQTLPSEEERTIEEMEFEQAPTGEEILEEAYGEQVEEVEHEVENLTEMTEDEITAEITDTTVNDVATNTTDA